MSTETAPEQLHDQTTRGGKLTEAERARLEAWYAQKDQEETALLGGAVSDNLLEMYGLRDELALAIRKLRGKLQQLEVQATESDTLRREIKALSE